MVSRAEVERARAEADTILTRIDAVESALASAREREGDHWAAGELDVELETPTGEPIEVTLDLDASAAENAQRRYERAKDLEARLERRREVAGELADLPADPLAYLVVSHLDTVEGDYPRSMARHLDAPREEVADLCAEMQTAGVLERIESGMLKRRKVKLKQSHETHQHHTYYRLSRRGDHLLRVLDGSEGVENALRHLETAATVAKRLSRGGPDYPRMTAEDLGLDLDQTRRLYAAMERVGVVRPYDGGTIKGTERSLKPKDETHRKHTYYVTTREADRVLRDWGE